MKTLYTLSSHSPDMRMPLKVTVPATMGALSRAAPQMVVVFVTFFSPACAPSHGPCALRWPSIVIGDLDTHGPVHGEWNGEAAFTAGIRRGRRLLSFRVRSANFYSC